MEKKEIIQDVICSLESLADAERQQLARSYYPTEMQVLGVKNPDIRTVVKSLKTTMRGTSPSDQIEVAKALVMTRIFECQQVAYEFIGKNKTLCAALSKEDVDQLNRHQDNWVSVDMYSAYILGIAWRLGTIDDAYILDKTRSCDFWTRRQSLVATLCWNQKARGGTGHAEKTLMICSLFVDDHHDMINKALSWALRELSKRDPQSVTRFMHENDSRLHGRVRREVWNKLRTGLKNPK